MSLQPLTHEESADSSESIDFESNPIHCANCELNISGKQNEHRFTEFALVDPDDMDTEEDVARSKYVSVTQAIAKVFGALMNLNHVEMPDPSLLVMCHQCITSLGELYRLYIGFLECTSDTSVIQALLNPVPNQHHQNTPLTRDVGISVTPEQIRCSPHEPVEVKLFLKADPNCEPIQYLKLDARDLGLDDEHRDEYIVPEIKISQRILTRSMTQSSSRPTKNMIKNKSLTKQKAGRYKFKCSKVHCLKKFPDDASFQAHLITHTKPSREPVTKTKTVFNCEEENCGKVFRSGKLYRRHRKFKHGEGIEHLSPEEIRARKCEQCSRIFGIPSQLTNHLKNVHATDKPFPCTSCDKKFPSLNYLSIHKRMKHKITSDPNHRVSKRLKNIKSKTSLQTPQPCTFCEEEFQRLVDLKVHVREKHPGEKFICSYEGCNKAFRCIRLFRRHKKVKHGEGLTEEVRKQLTCQLCDKVFGIPSQLRAHIESVHATEKNISCDLCPAMFPTINRLKIHKFTKHKDPLKALVQTYKCDKCDKTYNSASGYQYHVDTVHLQKTTYSFVCEHCGKKFARSDWLKAHQLIHEPNRPKPFQCSECLQYFLTRKNLLAHRKVHSGKKDLLCSICGRDFLHSQSLKRHILARHASDLPETGTINVSGTIVSQPQPHSCSQCGKTFKFREYLLQHLRSKTHGGKGHTAQRRREEKQPLETDSGGGRETRVTIGEVIDHTEEIELVPQQIQVIETKDGDNDSVTESSYYVQLLIQ